VDREASAGEGTFSDVRSTGNDRRGEHGRHAALALLLVLLLVALTGWLGVHSETTAATSGGYRLSLTYPRVARSGLDIPWILQLTHPGGFSGPVTISMTADYFDIFEFQGMHPQPATERSDGSLIDLTFARPKGDEFRVSLDTYVQPASQIGRDATVGAIVHGVTVAQLHFSTWLVP
jgi:hypothetical protein